MTTRALAELAHPDRVLWPEPGYTKADYLAYLEAVAPALLPHLRARPLVLTRYPAGYGGKSFYQKNLPETAPRWLQTFTFTQGRRPIRHLLCHDVAALRWLAAQAAIEFHPWMSRVDHPDFPDLMAIDLDPTAPADFEDARQVAGVVRELLARVGLRGYAKTSGATGIHVMVPIVPRYRHQRVAAAVRRIGLALARLWPRRVTLERSVAKRDGRVYVDFPQNGLGRTLVGVYCPRPLPGAPVSAPFDWSELDRVQPRELTLATLPARLAHRGDLFAGTLEPRTQGLEELEAWL